MIEWYFLVVSHQQKYGPTQVQPPIIMVNSETSSHSTEMKGLRNNQSLFCTKSEVSIAEILWTKKTSNDHYSFKDERLHSIPLKNSAFCLKTLYFINK